MNMVHEFSYNYESGTFSLTHYPSMDYVKRFTKGDTEATFTWSNKMSTEEAFTEFMSLLNFYDIEVEPSEEQKFAEYLYDCTWDYPWEESEEM